MRTDLPVLTPAPSQPRVNGAPSDTLESGAKLFIGVGGVLLLFALGSAVSEARFLARSATTDGVVRSGQPAGPSACVAMIQFQTADGKEYVYQQRRVRGTGRNSRPPQCTAGEIVPLAFDPGDPGRTVTVAGSGYERARHLLFGGGVAILVGLGLGREASKRKNLRAR